jgi:uncharacterized RDD family membrane protein YckC
MREAMISLELLQSTTGPQVEYAGFRSRAVAKTVDLLILLACIAAVDLVLGTTIVAHPHGLQRHPVVSAMLCFLAWFSYEALMESSKRQATIGKRALGIIVTDLEGKRITARQAAVRSVAQVVSGCLFVGYVLAIFTRRKQALHDFIADTLVCPGSL